MAFGVKFPPLHLDVQQVLYAYNPSFTCKPE
jgi:hypothetical protein